MKFMKVWLLAIGAHISGPNEPRALATWPNIVNKPKKKILDSGVNSIITKPCTKSSLTKIFKDLNV